MFDEDDVQKARRAYSAGHSPADILRASALERPDASVVRLMRLLEDAFGLAHEDVQCIGGWWHDGTGELSDARINAFIAPAIERSVAKPRKGDER